MNAEYSLLLVERFCWTMAALLLLLFLFLVARKVRLNGRERKLLAFLDAFGRTDSSVERFLATGAASRRLQPRTGLQLEALAIFLHRRLGGGGSQRDKDRIKELATHWLAEDFRLKLQSRKRKVRQNALLQAGAFHLKTLVGEVSRLTEPGTFKTEERWSALRVLALLEDDSIWERLLAEGKLRSFTEVSSHQLRRVLSAMSDGALAQAADPEFWEALPERLQENVIDVLRIRHIRSAECLQLFESLLDGSSAELRIRAFKALANFGYMSPEAEERFVSYVESAEMGWTERMMAARLMGDIPQPAYVPVLERWMGDTAYLVRLEAGTALARYPKGRRQLERISAHHPDRFARETAAELLERGDAVVRLA